MPADKNVITLLSPSTNEQTSAYVISDYIFLWKPSGIASTPGLRPSIQGFIGYDAITNASLPERGLLNRLDVCTHGLVIIATTAQAYDRYQDQQADDRVFKYYSATVYGKPKQSGCIITHLGQHRDDKRRVVVRTPTNASISKKRYPTQTLYTLDQYDPVSDTSIISLCITRGFRHQIRIHCAHLGHPIVGDTLYIPRSHPAYTGMSEPDHIDLSCGGYTLSS